MPLAQGDAPCLADDGDASDARYACYDANYADYDANCECCDENCGCRGGSCEWEGEQYGQGQREDRTSRTSRCIVDNDFGWLDCRVSTYDSAVIASEAPSSIPMAEEWCVMAA